MERLPMHPLLLQVWMQAQSAVSSMLGSISADREVAGVACACSLPSHGCCAGIAECRQRFPGQRLTVLWLGSSVGNLAPADAVQFFRGMAAGAGSDLQARHRCPALLPPSDASSLMLLAVTLVGRSRHILAF